MNNTIQLYIDHTKTVMGYPITTPDRVVDESGENIEEKINTINEQMDINEKKINEINIHLSDFKEYYNGIDITVALQKAIEKSNLLYHDVGASGYGLHSRPIATPKIIIPYGNGMWEISDSIKIGTSLYIEGNGKPILKGINMNDKFLFVSDEIGQNGMPSTVKIEINNIQCFNFFGFANFNNNGQESSQYSFKQIDVKGGEYVFKMDIDSSIFNVQDCMFEKVKYVYTGGSDKAKFKDCWIVQGYFTSSDDGTFKLTSGQLVLDNICGVPTHPSTRPERLGGPISDVKNYAWVNVENNAQLYIYNFRGGGELGGSTLVNWKAPFIKSGQGNSLYPSILVIRDSQGQDSVFNYDNLSEQCSVRLYSLPNIFVYDNNFGANGSKYIVSIPDGYTKQDLYNNSIISGNNQTGYIDGMGGLNWEIKNTTSRLQGLKTPVIVHPLLEEFFNVEYNKKVKYDNTSYEYNYDSINREIIIDLTTPKWYFWKGDGDSIYLAHGLYDINYNLFTSKGASTKSYFNYTLVIGSQYNGNTWEIKPFLTEKFKHSGNTKYPSIGIIKTVVIIDGDNNEQSVLTTSYIKGIRIKIDCSSSSTEPRNFQMIVEKKMLGW